MSAGAKKKEKKCLAPPAWQNFVSFMAPTRAPMHGQAATATREHNHKNIEARNLNKKTFQMEA